MSARVKYGSAFSPVIPSKSILNHPFSIKNLLNLDDQEGVDREDNKTSTDFPTPCQHLPRKTRPVIEDKGLAADKLNLNCTWPAWVYATRYSRHGIPAGRFLNCKLCCISSLQGMMKCFGRLSVRLHVETHKLHFMIGQSHLLKI